MQEFIFVNILHQKLITLLETCSHHTFLWFHAMEYSLLPSKYFSRINHPFYAPKSLENSYKAHSNHRMTKPLLKPFVTEWPF